MITERSLLIELLKSKGFEPCTLEEMTFSPFVDPASYREGLCFMIPEDWADYVFKEPNNGPIILVKSLNDGWRKFNLYSFFKKVWAYDKDERPLGCWKCANGSAIDHIYQFSNLRAALDSLAASKIYLYVSKVEEYYRRSRNGLERCTIPTIVKGRPKL